MAIEYKRMRQLRGTPAEWAARDLVIGDGELALEVQDDGTYKIKIGTADGETYSALDYFAPGDGSSGSSGYLNIPQNIQTGNYTTVLDDSGKHLLHPTGAGAGDVFTIANNASVPYELGTVITFVNADTNTLSITITGDTLVLAGSTTTGARTLAQNGVATAIKATTTVWIISGTGLT